LGDGEENMIPDKHREMVSKSLSHKQARPDGMCLMIPGMQEAKVG
jgi:hypothetical protein